jgi:hypothetical protein
MTKLTDTEPTPSKFCRPDSTADVHAPHVMPSTLSVVVVMCVGGAMLASEEALLAACVV